MGTKIFTRNEKILLVLAIALPFIVINTYLYTAFDGVHGTVYSKAEANQAFYGTVDGEPLNGTGLPPEGHFKGDLNIEGSTGWVICNGKIRFSGPIHINNADVHYKVDTHRDPDYFMDYEDYKRVNIEGDSGEMEEGFPLYYIGIIGSLLGTITWASFILIRRIRRTDAVGIMIPFILVNVATLALIESNSLASLCMSFCMGLNIILLLIIGLMLKNKEYYIQSVSVWKILITCTLIIGFAYLVIGCLLVQWPSHTDNWFAKTYDRDLALSEMRTGWSMFYSAAILIGFSLGGFHRDYRDARCRRKKYQDGW